MTVKVTLVASACALISAFAWTAPASAQAAPAENEPSSPIIVERVRDREQEVRRFVHALTPAKVRGQLARFEGEVCPAAVGLSPRQNGLVADRIRQVAAGANVAVGKPTCDANVIVIVTKDKAAFLKRLRNVRPDYFPADWSFIKHGRLIKDPSPVAAWHIEGRRRADGREVPRDFGDFLVNTNAGASSRISPPVRPDFLAAIVVVDLDALEGLTPVQLADYAAMRTLVRTEPGRLGGLATDTILRVIDAPMGTPVPLTMTDWDLRFLTAYYASGKNNYATGQRSDIARLMNRDTEGKKTDR